MARKHWVAGMLLATLVATGGCVERKMVITSEPAGALVTVNQTWKGKTPFELPFMHYGVYDIRIEHEGYYPLHVAEPVAAPLYEQPGLDVGAEVLWPGRVRDVRKLHYKMEPITEPDNITDIIKRKEEMRQRAERISARREEQEKKRLSTTLPLPEKKKHDDKDGDKPKAKASDDNPGDMEDMKDMEPADGVDATPAAPAAPAAAKESTAKATGPELE